MELITYTPIGLVVAEQKYKYQQPRQGKFASNKGKIVLEPGHNFEQALTDLAGFTKIWLLYHFHQNQGWHPKVDAPICPDGKKKGVFATRSPYRPNSIGLSCVNLTGIKGREIFIANFDLLHNTPILDIKPYICHYDSYPDASTGWVPNTLPQDNHIQFSTESAQAAQWLLDHNGPDLFDLAQVQLAMDPLNQKRKRINILPHNQAELAFRTWRLLFQFQKDKNEIEIISIYSGYNAEQLSPNTEDQYADKELHREFKKEFGV